MLLDFLICFIMGLYGRDAARYELGRGAWMSRPYVKIVLTKTALHLSTL
jgi:hypothetical protein